MPWNQKEHQRPMYAKTLFNDIYDHMVPNWTQTNSQCDRNTFNDLMSNGNKRWNKKVHCFVGEHLASDPTNAPLTFLFPRDSSRPRWSQRNMGRGSDFVAWTAAGEVKPFQIMNIPKMVPFNFTSISTSMGGIWCHSQSHHLLDVIITNGVILHVSLDV